MNTTQTSQPFVTSETQIAVERCLLDLWQANEMEYSAETAREFGGLLYKAWDEVQQRIVMKFIVSEPITHARWSELSIDLAKRLEAEHKRMLADEKAQGLSDAEALDHVWAYEADHIDVFFLESQIDDETRLADLMGVYAPQLYLHIVPEWVTENEQAGHFTAP